MVLGVRTGGGAFADGSRSPDRESRLQVTKSLPRTPTVPAPASENQPGGIGDRRARIGRKMARFSNRGTTVLVPRPLAAAPVMARAQALATHRRCCTVRNRVGEVASGVCGPARCVPRVVPDVGCRAAVVVGSAVRSVRQTRTPVDSYAADAPPAVSGYGRSAAATRRERPAGTEICARSVMRRARPAVHRTHASQSASARSP